MNSKLLSFELTESNDEIEIHCNEEGLDTLLHCLELVKKYKTHDHLISDIWGGNELTSELQGDYSGVKKPSFRNGGNRQTGTSETALAA